MRPYSAILSNSKYVFPLPDGPTKETTVLPSLSSHSKI